MLEAEIYANWKQWNVAQTNIFFMVLARQKRKIDTGKGEMKGISTECWSIFSPFCYYYIEKHLKI